MLCQKVVWDRDSMSPEKNLWYCVTDTCSSIFKHRNNTKRLIQHLKYIYIYSEQENDLYLHNIAYEEGI